MALQYANEERVVSQPQCLPQQYVSGHQTYEPQTVSESAPGLPTAWAQDYSVIPNESLLGSGSFAKIFRARARTTGQDFAIKVMQRPFFACRGIENQITREIGSMRRCVESQRCRHVVRLLESVEEQSNVYLRMEICHRGTLGQHARSQPGCRAAESDVAGWAKQLLLGLSDLHSLGIMHRDIKPDNLLLTQDGDLKICDFGWAADIRDSPSSLAGTFLYMAPEVLEVGRVHTAAVDVWSTGATLFEILVGRYLLPEHLLNGMDPNESGEAKAVRLLEFISREGTPLKDVQSSHFSEACWDLLRSMLMPIVAERVLVFRALNHHWLQRPSSPVHVGGLHPHTVNIPNVLGSQNVQTLPGPVLIGGTVKLPQYSPPVAQLNARAFLNPSQCFTVSSPETAPSVCSTATPSEASTPPASIIASSPEFPQHFPTHASAFGTCTIRLNALQTSSGNILPPQPLVTVCR